MSDIEQSSQALAPTIVEEAPRFGPMPLPLELRLLKSVGDFNGGCWTRYGAENGRGYSVIKMGSAADGTRHQKLAHRLSYECFVAQIPKDMMVLHRCDNRRCINPSHLFLGTAKDNTADMIAKGRSNRNREGQWTGVER